MELTRYTRKEDVQHQWYVVDVKGMTLGRIATKIADVLRGKNKPHYTPSVDCGDYVVVVNADKVNLTGKKWEQKSYYSYSGYQSGLKEFTAEKMVVRHPEHLVRHAVRGMLPKNKLARQVLKKLKVYASADHPHTGQSPEQLKI